MDIVIEDQWQSFVTAAVETGRFGSASDVVTEGLRLVEERERRFLALRKSIQASIALGDRTPMTRLPPPSKRRWIKWTPLTSVHDAIAALQ